MAQELQLIVDLLKEMRNANNTSTEGFDRLLESISKKLDSIEGNTASNELIKAYLGELTKNVEEKYSTTLMKFNDIERALKSIYNEQEEHVKNKNMQELFDIFSKNMNGFYTEAKQQKAILAGIETRLADIGNDTSDKEDIMRTITLLRNDFENLNHAYKSTIDNVNANLNSILANLINMDQTKINTYMKEQLEVMYKATSDIVNYLKSIDEKDSKMESLLANVATNESLKITQGIVDSIIVKAEEISKQITSIADKSDIEGLQTAAIIMNQKLENTVTKEEFSKITLKAEDLVNLTEEVKISLADVARNIESIPDTAILEKSIQDLFVKFNSLEKDLSSSNLKGDIYDIDAKIILLKEELSTVKNIIIDLNEVITSKVLSAIKQISFQNESCDIKNYISNLLAQLPQKDDIDRILQDHAASSKFINSLLEKTDKIADKLDALPTHQDMELLNNNQLELVENLQEVANKEDIESIEAKTDEIEEMIDKLNFDSEFENIYDKTSSIEQWLINSNIKENTDKIVSQITDKAEKNDLIEILETTKKIVSELEELSHNTDVKKVNRTVADVYAMIEELKNEFINAAEMHNDSVIVQLAELQKSITENVTAEEFNNFIEDLRDFTQEIEISTVNHSKEVEDIKSLQQDILDALENIRFDNKIDNIDEKLTSLTEYINTDLKINNEDVKKTIQEIKELIRNKKSNFEEIENQKAETNKNIINYIDEIKNIIQSKDSTSNNTLLETTLNNIEDKLVNYQTLNEVKFDKILQAFDNYEQLNADKSLPFENIASSIAEISEIKHQIRELCELYATSSTNQNNDITNFIRATLGDLVFNMDELTKNIETGLQQGFAYNAELVEEKTEIILDLVRDLRHASTENIDLYKQLTVTDNKLTDIKQELELINTDVITTLNSKTDMLINELNPIKEMISSISSGNSTQDNNDLLESINNIHSVITEELKGSGEYSQKTFEKLEDIYNEITNKLSNTENNLRDFILGDIDTVIIKLDSLKDDLEAAVNKLVPPDASQMEELNKFVAEINSFKEDQKIYLTEVANDIKTSISEQLNTQNEEVKSLLNVAVHNDEILEAIENLKNCFKITAKKISQDSTEDEFDFSNNFDEIFDGSKITKVLDELKDDFYNVSQQINDLSGDNLEIKNILDVINNKLETISIEDAEFITEESDITGSNDFDFIQALDYLKQDILKLRQDIEKAIPLNEKLAKTINSSSDEDNILLKELITKLADFSNTVDNKWFEEIKEYLAGNEIKEMLSEINEKVNILTLTDNTELVNEIKETLNELNSLPSTADANNEIQSTLNQINVKIDILTSTANSADEDKEFIESNEQIKDILSTLDTKVDILATSDSSDSLEDIRESIDDNFNNIEDKINELSDSDVKMTSMLEALNYKIDILASTDNFDAQQDIEEVKHLILSQMDYIEKLENNTKTDAFKKCLQELTQEVNNIHTNNTDSDVKKALKDMKESIMAAVVTIFDQVSFIEESEDIKDFVEEKTDIINQNLEEVTRQLKQITSSDDDSDYTYTMQDIESDLAKLRMALNDIQNKDSENSENELSNISDSIQRISLNLEELQNSMTQDEISDLKLDIANLKEQTQQLLLSSGESYKNISNHIAHKVDKVTNMLEKSTYSDKVMRQALVYMGEWIDSANERIDNISTNSNEIVDIKTSIESLKIQIPEQTNILNSIEEKFEEQQTRLSYFEKQISKLGKLEEKFELQQERIDRLEMTIEKILNVVEDIDDTKISRKIDKIDKQMAKLSTNIEKLTAYVD